MASRKNHLKRCGSRKKTTVVTMKNKRKWIELKTILKQLVRGKDKNSPLPKNSLLNYPGIKVGAKKKSIPSIC